MNPLIAIKRIVQAGAALLLAMFGYPLTAWWFETHPDAGASLEAAAMIVDPHADRVTQAGQLVSNIDKGRREVAEQKREKAEEKAYEEAERKRREMRDFNTGKLGDED